MQNKILKVKISKTGLVFVTDKRTGKTWSSGSSPVIIKCWNVSEERLKEVFWEDCSVNCISSTKTKTICNRSRAE